VSDGVALHPALESVRVYWIQYPPTFWLFPGKRPDKTYGRHLDSQSDSKSRVGKPGIKKNVYLT